MRTLMILMTGLVFGLAGHCPASDVNLYCHGVDLDGRPLSPFDSEAELTVLVFVSCDCPISNRYVPTLRTLSQQYAGRSVKFWLVYPDPRVTAARIKQHLIEYKPEVAALSDPRHELVEIAEVTKVPEAAVFVRDNGRQVLVYHGGIDNRFVDFGVARPNATAHYLRDVLDSTLAGGVAVFPSWPAIGCTIPRIQ